jgi:Preprotein translocase subunit SecD
MAVDANVIIYERIKEELASGKGFSKAVADGYKNAYSAIIDGQVTTLLTGIILYVFGSGPVQGFATTLIIGIITSVLTSIFVTRLIFDDRIAKGKTVSLSNSLTRNFLKNTHVDFIGLKKYSYAISGALTPHRHRLHRLQGLQLRCRLHRWPYLHRPLRPERQG